jgi:hypothetical protein
MEARHIRGLEEKIWKQLAPTSTARRAAFTRAPDVEQCNPMRILSEHSAPGGPPPPARILPACRRARVPAATKLRETVLKMPHDENSKYFFPKDLTAG